MQKSTLSNKPQFRRKYQPGPNRSKSSQIPFYPDNTLKRTIGHMQEYFKGLKSRDNAAEMEFLQSLLSQYNIRIVPEFFRGENSSSAESRPDQSKPEESAPTNLDAVNNVTATNFAYLRDVKLGRVLLYGDRNCGDFSHPISFECNGVILDTETWKPLVIPSAAFNTNPNNKAVASNMHNYKIYPIFDGTLVNLYYYGGNWCMGSKHGYDVSHHKWIGDKTYIEAFKSALGTVSYDDFVAALSPDACYSVLFRCSEFHPLLNDPQQVQLVRIADLTTMDEVEHTDPRYLKITQLISEQKPYEDELLFCDLYHLITEANSQQQSSQQQNSQSTTVQDLELRELIGKQKIKSLISRNQNALDDYLRSVPVPKKGKDATAFKTHAPHLHYGYILRDSRWHSVSHVMLESTLLKQIRQYIYNLPKPNKQHATIHPKINESNRLNYSILRAYLSPFGQREQFLRLFPQFTATYGYYDDIMMKITKRVIKQFKGHNSNGHASGHANGHSSSGKNPRFDKHGGLPAAKSDQVEKASAEPEPNTDSKKIEVISRELYKHISSREKINPFDKNSVSLIRNYIEHAGNINFLFVALHGQ